MVSLQGKDGKDGAQGPQGEPGPQGLKGEPGENTIIEKNIAPSYAHNKILSKTGDDVLYSIKLLIAIIIFAVATMFLV